MGKHLQRVLLSLLIAGQLSFAPAKSLAKEVKSFKNYSEQNKSMPVLKKQPQFSSLTEIGNEVQTLMGKKEKKIPNALYKYSNYQLGQLALSFLFEYYKMSPKERAKSEDGKKMYFILRELYKHKKNKGFNEGFQDEKIHSKLEKNNPNTYPNFVHMFVRYDEYYTIETEADRTPLPLLTYLLEGYDKKKLPTLVPKPPKTVDMLTMITDSTLNQFVSDFFDIAPKLPREEAAEELSKAFQEIFGTTEENAKRLVKAILYSYSSFVKPEERKSFITWLKELDEKGRKKLVTEVERYSKLKKTVLPTSFVVEMFKESKYKAAEKKKLEKEMEKELKSYAAHIKEGSIKKFVERFEKEPAGSGLDLIEMRTEYIQKKIDYIEFKEKKKKKEKEELVKLKKELKFLKKWLGKFDLLSEKYGTLHEESLQDKIDLLKGKEDVESKEELVKLNEELKLLKNQNLLAQIDEIRNGMGELQENYILIDIDYLEIINNIENTSPPKLRDIYLRYLLLLDEVSGRLFVDIDTTEDLSEQITDIVFEKFDKVAIEEAQGIWQDQYYKYSVPIEALDPQTSTLYDKIANLELPLLAVVFWDYAKQVEDSGVGSPEEKDLVVNTAAKLAGLHPLLLIKYFSAMTHIAELCKDNPDAYIQAVTAISARVDAASTSVYSRVTAFQMGAPNMRKIINKLANGFDAILDIEESSLTQYNKYDVVDDNLEIDEFTNVITQKSPPYIPSLTKGKESVYGYLTPSPFPPYLSTMPHGTPYTEGQVMGAGQKGYEGGIGPTQLNPLWVSSGADPALTAVKGYLYELHPFIGTTDYLPGTLISGLSITELLKMINSAFVPVEPLGYETELIAGGFGAGGGGKYLGEELVVGVAGLGTFITPTGGAAFGGNYEYPGHTAFAGGSMVAIPLGTIKSGVAKGTEVGVESFAGGYEKLEEDAQKLLLTSIVNSYDPKNPSDLFINVNLEHNEEGKGWMTSRLFYVDKYGTVFEVKGGKNDFVDMFNFIAGSFDETFKTPVLGIWNVEPKVKEGGRGGGALAIDLGKTTWLSHFQAVPFLTADVKAGLVNIEQQIIAKQDALEEKQAELEQAEQDLTDANSNRNEAQDRLDAATTDEERAAAQAMLDEAQADIDRLTTLIGSDVEGAETGLYRDIVNLNEDLADLEAEKHDYVINKTQQPLLYEWTFGFAWTTEKGEKTTIPQFTFPGKYLKLQKAEEGEVAEEDQYFIQDAVFKVRQVESENAWELSIGGGFGGSVKKWVDEVGNIEGAKSYFGRGGFFYKSQTPKTNWGTGLYYEGVPSFVGLAMLEESEEAREYIESLHKIGVSLYGSGEVANNFFLGALGHFMEQLRPHEVEGKTEWDPQTFYRFVGFLKGVDNAMKIEALRVSGFDEMLKDYNTLLSNVSKDPQNGGTFISQFKNRYEKLIRQVFDEYYLGVQVNKDFSLQAKLVFKEEEAEWTKQMADTVQVKALATWDTGFWRLYASIPTWMPAAVEEEHVVRAGLVGMGFGFDVFNSYFLQRIAFDAGALLAFDEAESEITGIKEKKLKEAGGFAQAAVMLYSNVLEESKLYRKLVKNYEKYDEAIEKGAFSKISGTVLDEICDGVDEGVISPKLLKKIRDGEDVLLTDAQTESMSDALWEWFYDEKTVLEEKFNGKVNTYLAGDMFFYNKNKIHWDIGFFFEYVDKVKLYTILAEREKLGLYAGIDVNLTPKAVLSAVTNVTLEEKKEGMGALSFKFKARYGWWTASAYIKSKEPPIYSNPAYVPYKATGTHPEWAFMVYYTLGFGGGTPVQFSPAHTPTGAPKPWWQSY